MNIQIKNDNVLAEMIAGQGKSQAGGLGMASVAIQGARSAEVEKKCRISYEEGRNVAANMKGYLEDTYRCMEQISDTFLRADGQAAKSNLGK